MEIAEGVHGVIPEQVTTLQRVVLTFLRGADRRCGSRIRLKTQGIVHLRLTVVAMEPSMLLGNGLQLQVQVVTLQAPTANNPITLPAMLNTINSSTLNSKSVPRHSSSHTFSRGNPYVTLSTAFPTLHPDGPGHSSPSSA